MSRILRRHELVADDWITLIQPAPVVQPAAAAASQDAPAVHVASNTAGQLGTVGAAPAQTISDADSVIVPFAKFRESRDTWLARSGRLGIRLAPADRVEDLAPDLSRIALVALEFTGPGEGRGYSAAKLLRQRYKFTGEIRAVGHVKQDQLYMMARCGIDAFELSPTEKVEEALETLARFKVAYTPGFPVSSVQRQRFHT